MAIWAARGPRGPGRTRGPGAGPPREAAGALAYLVRRARRHRTRSSRSPARARPGKLSPRSDSSSGSSAKRSMLADVYSAVRFARGRAAQPRVSLRAARRGDPAAWRGFSPPRSLAPARDAGLLGGAARNVSAGPRGWVSKFPDSLRPRPVLHPRARPSRRPPPARRLLANGAGRRAEAGEGVGISRERASEGPKGGAFCSGLAGSVAWVAHPFASGGTLLPLKRAGRCPPRSGAGEPGCRQLPAARAARRPPLARLVLLADTCAEPTGWRARPRGR